jgi:hypothetical protein
MKTLRVVVHRHIFPDISNCFLPSPIQPVTGPLPFQAAKETFYWRVVPAVTLAAHATDHPILFQQGLVGMTRILATTIGVMDLPRWWLPEIDCHHQGPDQQGFLNAPSQSQLLRWNNLAGPITPVIIGTALPPPVDGTDEALASVSLAPV